MEVKPDIETYAKIKVVGIGGAGNSVVNRMIESGVKGVEFIAINTDAQALHHSLASKKIHIGQNATRGLGAGMDPDIGRQAAEEDLESVEQSLKGADMIFITCGMGGGTGSGASPVVAEVARRVGALTVAMVTTPFSFEGAQRSDIAKRSRKELSEQVDTIISVPNDRLLKVIDKKMSLIDSFKVVDEVLKQGVQGISEIITVPGLINVDFADVRAIMQEAGTALMGIGEAEGEDRAVVAAKQAIDSPLLDMTIDGAKGVLFIVSGPEDMTMNEVNDAARTVTASADSNAKVIFGTLIDEKHGDSVKVTVIATGFGEGGSKRVHRTDMEDVMSDDVFSGASKPADRQIFEEPNVKEDVSPKDQDELDIPAFIRKKMKKK